MRQVLIVVMLMCAALSRAESPAPQIEVDFTDAPEMNEWALGLQKDLLAFYPTIAEKLGSAAYVKPNFKVLIKKDVKGSGYTQGTDIVLGASYFQGKPKETGTAVFYLTRVMQSYKAKKAPGWLVTGIADYIRWWNYEPVERRRKVDPKEAKYTNGFNDTAAFLVWLEKTRDKAIVSKLNQALYTDTFTLDLFKTLTGKDVDALWADFLASIRKEADEAARAIVDPAISKPVTAQPAVTFVGIGTVEFTPPENGLTIRYTLDGSFPTAKSYAYCAPLKIASTLTLRAAAFNKDGKCSDAIDITCTREKNAEADTKVEAAINVDFSDVPDLKDWALKAQKDAQEYYVKIVEMLHSEGFNPSRQITFIFTDDAEGPLGPGTPAFAIAAQSKIYFAANHIRSNKNDFGMVIHELTHIVQNYGYGKNTPSWLVEGIADYVRWENWEKPAARRKINPLKAKYTNGYSDTARFLSFIESTYDKEVVRKLNADLRKNAYKDEKFKVYAGKDLNDLWNEFIGSLSKPAAP